MTDTTTATATYTPTRGDIFVTSWGYDQTNVDAYQVREVSKSRKSIKVQTIAIEVLPNGRVKPSKGAWTNTGDYVRDNEGNAVRDDRGLLVRQPEVMTKRVQFADYRSDQAPRPYIKIASYAFAYLWDGEREFYDTRAAGQPGH